MPPPEQPTPSVDNTVPLPEQPTTAVHFTATVTGGGHAQQGSSLTINNHHAPITHHTHQVHINTRSQSSSLQWDTSSKGLVHNTDESQDESPPEKDLYNTDQGDRLDFPPGLLTKSAKGINRDHAKEFWSCYKHFHKHPECLTEVKELVQQKGGAEGVLISQSEARIDNYIHILKDLMSKLSQKGRHTFIKLCCNELTNHGVKVKGSNQGPQSMQDIQSIISSDSAMRLQNGNNLFMPSLMHACVHSLSTSPGKGNDFYRKFVNEIQEYCQEQYSCPFTFTATVQNAKKSSTTGKDSRKREVEHPVMTISKSRISEVKSAVQKHMMDYHGITSVTQADPKESDDDICIVPIDKLSLNITNMGGTKKKATKDTKDSRGEGELSDNKKVAAKEAVSKHLVKVRKSNFGGAGKEEIRKLLGKSENAIAYYLLAKTAVASGVEKEEFLREAGTAFDIVRGLVGRAPTSLVDDGDWDIGVAEGDEGKTSVCVRVFVSNY